MLSLECLNDIQTPCFVYDIDEYRKNLLDFQSALRRVWGPCSNVAYSVKTNPLSCLLDEVRSCACLAEVVSDDEYCFALDRGFAPDEIIFNGPIKGRACFEFALERGSIVNIDSQREITWLEELAGMYPSRVLRVGVRVNIALEAYCPGETTGGGRKGRFGFSYEDGALGRVLKRLSRFDNIQIAGLHMHVTTLTRSQRVYRTLASYAARAVSEYGLEGCLDYIDIGGGFYGGGPRNLGAYDAYTDTIAGELSASCDASRTALYVEPGGAVVCTPGYYYGRVADVKDIRGERFVVSELSRLNIDHEMKKTSHPLRVQPASGVRAPLMDRQVLCGFTCMESDRLCVLEDFEELNPGDLLEIRFAGAYSQSFTPGFFICNPPAVYTLTQERGLELKRALFSPCNSLARAEHASVVGEAGEGVIPA